MNESSSKISFGRSATVEEFKESGLYYSATEEALAKNFLSQFTFVSRSSSNDVNLKYFVKALPMKITMANLHRCSYYQFFTVQKSLIEIKYYEVDEMFQFYDNRNKTRFKNID